MWKDLRILISRWRAVFRARRLEQDFGAEIESHLKFATEEHIRQGLAPEEAARAARISLGGVTQLRETQRELRGLPWIETAMHDARYTLRTLRRNPGFAATAIITLALGIGANTAIFTVVNAVLLRNLPYARPLELVTWRHNESLLDLDDIRAQAHFFSAGGGVNPTVMEYTGGAEPLSIESGYVDHGLFDTFGVPAMLGRTFTAEEDRIGGPRVAVVAYSFWRQYLGADPGVLGKAMALNGNRYAVIGVMPPSFVLPEFNVEVYVPLRAAYPEAAAYRGVHFMQTYWRLKPGVTLARAASGMAAIDARLSAAHPAEDKNRHTAPVPLQQWVTGEVRPALEVLFGAVCLVLLIACANFAGLLMARAEARRHEMVVRAALGGNRGRLIRQALTESVLLALMGGVAGLLLAFLGTRLLMTVKPAALAQWNVISTDPAVLAFGLISAAVTGVVFGFIPAWNASRPGVADSLKQQGRTATAGPAGSRWRSLLVTGEMALALVLLAGAGLLVKGFARLRSVDPGFNPEHVVEFEIQLPATRYAGTSKQIAFRRELLAKLNALPGVAAAMVGDAPLNGNQLTHSLAFEGRTPVAVGDEPMVDTFCVMGDYFHVMQIPLRAGRGLTEMDRENQPLVAVINEALARQHFPRQNPIGQRIRWGRDTGPPRWMTIVGVAGDVKQYSLAQPAYPAVFSPFAQSNEAWRRWMSVVIRTSNSSAQVIGAVKRQIWSIDPAIPLNRIRGMEELVGRSFAERRFDMFLLSLFALLATILSAVGLYGVMAYSVSQRTHEIGIRVAVGARRGDVLKLVMKQGARLAAVGLGIGIVGALALTRLMRSLLFGVAPNDAATLAAVVLLMMGVTLVACVVPALRALDVDPMAALRDE